MSHHLPASRCVFSALLFGTLSLTGISSTHADSPGTQRPNVLFILLDDLGIAHSSIAPEHTNAASNGFQHEDFIITPEAGKAAAEAAMPHLSNLANESTRMTYAFAASPVCGPSRMAIMTARYPQNFGVYDNFDTRQPIDAKHFLPKLFQRSGYRTSIVGKWHLAAC